MNSCPISFLQVTLVQIGVLCTAFRLGEQHLLPNIGQNVHADVRFTPTHSPQVTVGSQLQQQNPLKRWWEPRPLRTPRTGSCSSLMVNLTTRPEHVWFVQGGPWETSTGRSQQRGCCYPVIDGAACNFQAGRPTSHDTNILLCAFYNITADFSLNKPSLVQASVSLLYNICRLVFLLTSETHHILLKEEFGVISQKRVHHPLQALEGTFVVSKFSLLLYPARRRGQET